MLSPMDDSLGRTGHRSIDLRQDFQRASALWGGSLQRVFEICIRLVYYRRMTRTETRDELIRVGRDIIRRQGFNHTGLNAVLSRANVPKGSFYYYFASKEQFGLAVIDQFAADYARRLETFLENDRVSPLQRIRDYLEDGVAIMEESACTAGCLIGNLGQELAAQSEVFRVRLEAVFGDWERSLARCLQTARGAGEIDPGREADELAAFLLTGWEGAILRAKVTKSVAPMRAFIDVLFAQVLKAPGISRSETTQEARP